ncbi:MAG: hypothetical protein HY400_00135 [Elusimicrobia bacterium]|nr:hypothetical protein [Elusimicrobiota bacterium]
MDNLPETGSGSGSPFAELLGKTGLGGEKRKFPDLKALWDVPKEDRWKLGVVVLAALLIGLVVGKMMTGGTGQRPAKLNLAQGQWVRPTSSSFEIFLPRGWENISAEANLGVAGGSKREVVFRQKEKLGGRLLMIQRFNLESNSEKRAAKEKMQNFLGNWIVQQRQTIQGLKQETASFFSNSLAGGGGVPVVAFQLLNPSGGSGAAQAFTGAFVFKGSFYEFSYITSSTKESELILELLGSIREIKKFRDAYPK